MAKATIYAYTQSDDALLQWKCVLRYCAKCTCVHINDQEIDNKYYDNSPSIRFHIYHIILRCTTYGRLWLNDRKNCHRCKQDYDSKQSTKINTIKQLVMMDTTNSNLETSFYITVMPKLAFHIPHVHILGTNHCRHYRRTAFKQRKLFQDVLCHRDYSQRVVASFTHQIKSEYYIGNRFISIADIALEHFSALPETGINSSTKSIPRHAVLHSFLLDDIKQYAVTTTSHSKRLIELIKEKTY